MLNALANSMIGADKMTSKLVKFAEGPCQYHVFCTCDDIQHGEKVPNAFAKTVIFADSMKSKMLEFADGPCQF